MKKALVFPYKSKHISFVRYFAQLQNEYILTHVCSSNGTDMIGKDIGYADNRNELGIIVESLSNNLITSIDTIIILDDVAENEDNVILDTIEMAVLKGKEVFCFADIEDESQDRLNELSKNNNAILKFNACNNYQKTLREEVGKRAIEKIETPIIFVCGLLSEGNQQEISVGIAAKLKNKGFNVSVLVEDKTFNFFEFYSYSDILQYSSVTDRIYAVNSLAKHIEEVKRPDALIVQIPGNVMRNSDKFPGDFGSGMFEFSQALFPDYCVCSVLYDHYNQAFFEMIALDILQSFKFDLNCIHITNKKMNFSLSEEKHALHFYNMPQANAIKLANTLKCECSFPVYHLLNDIDLNDMTDNIISEFSFKEG